MTLSALVARLEAKYGVTVIKVRSTMDADCSILTRPMKDGTQKLHLLPTKMELKPSGELATHETARILRTLGIRASDFGIFIG